MNNVTVTCNGESNNFKKFEKIVEEYAVYDNVAEMFMMPFRSPNKLKALQGFKDAVNDIKSPLNKHPECYALFSIGTFNEKTAERTNAKQLLAKASDLIEKGGEIGKQQSNQNNG